MEVAAAAGAKRRTTGAADRGLMPRMARGRELPGAEEEALVECGREPDDVVFARGEDEGREEPDEERGRRRERRRAARRQEDDIAGLGNGGELK